MAEYNGIKGEWEQRERVTTGEVFRLTGEYIGGGYISHHAFEPDILVNENDIIEVFVPEDPLAKYEPGTVLLGEKWQRAVVRSEQSWHWADDNNDTLDDRSVKVCLDRGYRPVHIP